MKVYDKVAWHYPDGKGCDSLDDAKRHLVILMDWLARKGLLSKAGVEIYESAGVDEEFSLTEYMLNGDGAKLLDEFYDEWLESIDYLKAPDTNILEEGLKSIHSKEA